MSENQSCSKFGKIVHSNQHHILILDNVLLSVSFFLKALFIF